MGFEMPAIEEGSIADSRQESDLAKERERDNKKNIGPKSEVTSEPEDKWEEVSLDDEEKNQS